MIRNRIIKNIKINVKKNYFQETDLDMYALYVKNKPSSDRLLAECGNFFHEKQKELNDKMDLASYLLKPVQRLTKYALFIDGISKNENGTEKRDLKRAQNLIEFQVCQFFTL